MSKRISDEANARRLARAIASDLKLYNEDAIRAGADLSNQVGEARALFEHRVSGPLHALFDEVMAELAPHVRYGGRPDRPSVGSRLAGYAERSDRFGAFYAADGGATGGATPYPPRSGEAQPARLLGWAVVVVLVALGVFTYLLTSG